MDRCVLQTFPKEIFQLRSLRSVSFFESTVVASSAPTTLSMEEWEFLWSRRTQERQQGRDLISRTAATVECGENHEPHVFDGLVLCVSLRDRSSSPFSRLLSEMADSSSSSWSENSTYMAVAFGIPGLFLVYKIILYVYFSVTYSRKTSSASSTMPVHHAQPFSTLPPPAIVAEAATNRTRQIGDENDLRPTSDESAASFDSAAMERRQNNWSFWIDHDLQPWRLDFDQITVLNSITTTAAQKRHMRADNSHSVCFCEVWLGTYSTTPTSPMGATKQFVALKYVSPQERETSATYAQQQERLKAQVRRQAHFSHPAVAAFVGIAWSMKTHLVVVTEYMPRGDLRQWLHRMAMHQRGQWTVLKLQMLSDITKALVYLHSLTPSLAHGSLNSRNVLLNDSMQAKLSDFGGTRVQATTAQELQAYIAVGSGRWISPEALLGARDTTLGSSASSAVFASSCDYRRTATPAASSSSLPTGSAAQDVYALGILMTEMDSHDLPFAEAVRSSTAFGNGLTNEVNVLQMIAEGELKPTLSTTCHPKIAELIHQCLAFNPDERPPILQVDRVLRTILDEYKATTTTLVTGLDTIGATEHGFV